MLTSSTNSVGLPQSSFKFYTESYFYSFPINFYSHEGSQYLEDWYSKLLY